MRLSVKAFSLALGLLTGSVFFALTLFVKVTSTGNYIVHLKTIFFGYQVDTVGAFLGFFYGFLYASIAGATFSFLYNLFVPKLPQTGGSRPLDPEDDRWEPM